MNPQYVVLFHHFRQFCEESYEHGIEVAPLKGAHLLTSVYGDNRDRGLLADVDFLVRARDWDRVMELLEGMGFERGEEFGRPTTYREFYETCYFLGIGGDKRIMFEPHRYLIQPMRHRIDYDALWERSYESEFDGVPCRRLSAEDHVLHSIIHMMTDSFINPKKGLDDLELLFRKGKADLDTVLKRAVEWECQRSTWLALTILDELLPEFGFKRGASKLAIPAVVKRALHFLVPDKSGFLFPAMGLRMRQAILFPLLIDGTKPLLRFATYYGWLRIRDRLEASV